MCVKELSLQDKSASFLFAWLSHWTFDETNLCNYFRVHFCFQDILTVLKTYWYSCELSVLNLLSHVQLCSWQVNVYAHVVHRCLKFKYISHNIYWKIRRKRCIAVKIFKSESHPLALLVVLRRLPASTLSLQLSKTYDIRQEYGWYCRTQSIINVRICT